MSRDAVANPKASANANILVILKSVWFASLFSETGSRYYGSSCVAWFGLNPECCGPLIWYTPPHSVDVLGSVGDQFEGWIQTANSFGCHIKFWFGSFICGCTGLSLPHPHVCGSGIRDGQSLNAELGAPCLQMSPPSPQAVVAQTVRWLFSPEGLCVSCPSFASLLDTDFVLPVDKKTANNGKLLASPSKFYIPPKYACFCSPSNIALDFVQNLVIQLSRI